MSRLNTTDLQVASKKNKSEAITAHVIATVNLFNNKPKAIRYYFDQGKMFMQVEVQERSGNIRNLKYFVFNETELKDVTDVLCSMYNIEAVETEEDSY